MLDFLCLVRIIGGKFSPNSLVVKHVLGKDESQVRFLLRAPEIPHRGIFFLGDYIKSQSVEFLFFVGYNIYALGCSQCGV